MSDFVRMASQVGEKTARRFFDKVQVAQSGCWEWQAARMSNGYGRFSTGTRAAQVVWFSHRFAYTYLVETIPEGLVLDHYVCENKGCCNPAHVRPVTRRENTLRGETLYAQNRSRTHCPRGHEYTEQNTRLSKRNQRHCRACARERSRERRASERGAAGGDGTGGGSSDQTGHRGSDH